jgi:hypothetical protein
MYKKPIILPTSQPLALILLDTVKLDKIMLIMVVSKTAVEIYVSGKLV